VTARAAQARAAREAFFRSAGLESIPWEELFVEDREPWSASAKAGTEASPELAEANATIGELRELLAEMIGEFSEGEFSALLNTHWRKAVVRPDVVAKWRKRAGLKS
jgi:hypothetical protein